VKRGGSLSFLTLTLNRCALGKYEWKTEQIKLVLLWAQLIKIYPPLPTSVQHISITKTLLIVPTYQLFTGEERRIPFFFDNFHLCRSRVIGLDMTKNRIFTLCRMITWVVFLRMFWNFISSMWNQYTPLQRCCGGYKNSFLEKFKDTKWVFRCCGLWDISKVANFVFPFKDHQLLIIA
jgi:hypothetical protein